MAEFVAAPKPLMTLSKAIDLFKNKHSCEMVERHSRAVKRVAAANKEGFLLKDLSELCLLLNILSQQLEANPQYTAPLCLLIKLCGKPFLKEKASDENAYTTQVLEILTLLGQLAVSCDDHIRGLIAKSLSSFYSSDPNHALLEGLQVTKSTYNIALLQRSRVGQSIVEALMHVKDHSVRLELLHTIHLFSSTSANCNHMLGAGLAQNICHIISLPDPDKEVLFLGIDILWNLLENGSRIKIGEQLSSIRCMRILKSVFYDLMISATSMQSKQLRNDVLMICLQIAQICPDAPFVETGFFSDLCTFIVLTEETGSRPQLQSTADSAKQFKLSQDYEDYELKKALMCILTTLSSEGATVKILTNKKVLRSLLSFVVQNDKAVGIWNPAQFEELQLMALSCLCTLAPLCIEDYMTCQGNTRILLLIEWCIKQEASFRGQGNSFHGEGGRDNKMAQLRQSLRLLLSMSSSGDDAVLQDLHEQGAIPILLGLLKHFMSIEADDSTLLEMQGDSLLILSYICEMDMHRKELFGGYDGINLVLGYLKRDIGKFGSGLGHSRLLLAATDCVWCTVVGNLMVEDIFLENGGGFVLLDLLKVCPSNMQNLILGVLVDLCENPKSIPHISSWKGSGNSSTWSLLAQLWRSEEWDMEVPRPYKNTLAGTVQPLVGSEQNARGIPPIPTNCPSAAITDVTENMRAKIYALCCKMGFQYPSEELSMSDKITICIIESYLDFKAGEVWYEVAGELAQEGLRPVTPDQECLTEILHTHEEKAEDTIKLQHELIEEEKRNELTEEAQFYDKIKEYHQVEERTKIAHEKFVKRTSNYEALKEAKRQQIYSLEASRRSNVAIGDRFHSLNQHHLNVTTFCGRRVSVATTPLKLLTVPVQVVSNSPASTQQAASTSVN